MVQYDPAIYLPTAEELPSSDETPVDNEFQDLVAHVLKGILAYLWEGRDDWYFGVDMGVYYHPRKSAIVPDGFLSLGVERFKIRSQGRKGRLSYVLWEENDVLPFLALEVVSQSYNGEYDEKKLAYAEIGILYYVVYDGDGYQPTRGDLLEVYRLVDGEYVRQSGEPVWIPELNLGLGSEVGTYQGWTREWLYWYNQDGSRLPSAEELRQQVQRQAQQSQLEAQQSQLEAQQSQLEAQQAQLEAQQAQLEAQQAQLEAQQAQLEVERLAAKLRELGIDPDEV